LKTIVIGGAGFIGAVVSQLLLASGREVTIVGRRQPGEQRTVPGCSYRCADLGNRAEMAEILEADCEVIDLAYATVPKTSFGDPLFDLQANLPASVALLEESMAAKVRRLLIVSSGGTVYGRSRSLPMDETHPTAPVSPYGITKLTIDHYALMFHHTRGLPVVVVRPANAYGVMQRARSGQGFLAAAIDAIVSGRTIEIYGPEGTIRDYIHVDDVARGIIAALECGQDGDIYNLGTGIGTSNLEALALLRPLALQAGRAITVNHLPQRRFDVEANVLDSARLSATSGWRPQVPLEQGLAQMWEHALKASSSA
jgi:UDP-glucose 4-epimerase